MKIVIYWLIYEMLKSENMTREKILVRLHA
jgi:hypothetical protein